MVVAHDAVRNAGGLRQRVAGVERPHGSVEGCGGATGGGTQHGRGRPEKCRRRKPDPEHKDRQWREGCNLIPLEVAAVCMALLASRMVATCVMIMGVVTVATATVIMSGRSLPGRLTRAAEKDPLDSPEHVPRAEHDAGNG